mmetsp:Transcript_20527/g.31145  ORF Transcript_20527/g.31145 Transcript_20527/m.31145 type:complete len:323 (+) Transcript_20527:99-1067(+)|eukprot:CAMPEP_0194118956 /NCGR_PEP_ID=MMETSP0150-20130528/37533_1 /TAXON_ID=122233 /ORGANISM="Chaetoceros debilis, Strain MM31A-1" /LENGTH=322 /DNA_ID=CAMNT_0038810503 /DNA_START=29 /DNA_END=997 /DNA_ORIENTATION=+
MPPKRPAARAIGGASKRRAVSVGPRVRVKSENGGGAQTSANNTPTLRKEFLDLFAKKTPNGISNTQLKHKFGMRYGELPMIINDLIKEARLTMSKVGIELYYNIIREDVASKFSGLDVQARMVYQIIEKAENMGIWTKDIRIQSNVQQQALNKIFKNLESRKLIKPVKSVTAKAKKLYMLYDLQPAKEVTGGPWYTELEFDHEFVAELRTFIMHCVRRLNGGRGVGLKEISGKMIEANVSRVQLSLSEVQQLIQTLAFDYMIEQNGINMNGEALFVEARRCSSACEFKWWEAALCPDFHFRDIRFEDDVVLSRHEPHHHTAS